MGARVSFVQRVRDSIVLKSPDVEEPIDAYFHRRLAALVTAAVHPTSLRPDHITWMSLFIGWAASAVMAMTVFDVMEDYGFFVAAALLLASVVLDCADGQLARARGGGTRMGRILDGLVDSAVLVPFYVFMGIDILLRHGWPYFALAAVAGFGAWIQIMVYDRAKSVYLANTRPGAHADGVETMEEVLAEYEEIKRSGTLFERFMMHTYINGQLKLSEKFSGSGALNLREVTEESAQAYRARFRPTMRLASILGLGTHMFFIYGGVLLLGWSQWGTVATQVVFVTLFIPMFLVISRIKAMNQAP